MLRCQLKASEVDGDSDAKAGEGTTPEGELEVRQARPLHRGPIRGSSPEMFDIAADDDEDDRSVDVVEARDLVLDVWHVAGEGEVGDSASEQDNDDLAEEEKEVDDTVEHDHPDQVPHQQVERVPGRLAEAGTLCGDVCRSHNLQNVCLITLTAHMMYAFLLMNLMNFSRQ